MLVCWYLNLPILIMRVSIYSCVSWAFVFSLMNYLFILILYSVFVIRYFGYYFDYMWSELFVVSIPGLYLFYEKQKVLFLFRIINYLLPWYSVYKVLPHLDMWKALIFSSCSLFHFIFTLTSWIYIKFKYILMSSVR